jgi:cysteine desulfurase/selenocysteine lyase
MRIPDDVREDIPLTQKLVYLDSAATSLTPRPVVEAMDDYYFNYRANVHRGLHRLSQKATIAYEQAHEKVAALINAKSNEVFFTKNATEALNHVATCVPQQGDIIVTTELEHHSNFIPWLRLRNKCEVRVVRITSEGMLDMGDFIDKIVGARIVAVTHTSNALGTITPLDEIGKIAREEGALLCVDAAQAAGHTEVDVKKLGADFLAFSAHKGPMGPTGIGVLYAKEEMFDLLPPMIVGGGMVEDVTLERWKEISPPERYEAGTPHIAGAIGLGAAVDYIQTLGVENIHSHEEKLTSHTLKRFGEIAGLTVYGPPHNRAAVISFNMEGLGSHDVAIILDEKGVCIRSGTHCAIPPLHALGIEETARASYHCYNTIEEIDRMADVLTEVRKSLMGTGVIR